MKARKIFCLAMVLVFVAVCMTGLLAGECCR